MAIKLSKPGQGTAQAAEARPKKAAVPSSSPSPSNPLPAGYTPIRHDDDGVVTVNHDGKTYQINSDGTFHLPHHAAAHFIEAHGFKVAAGD